MRLVVLLILLAAPLLELALMIKLGQRIGFWPEMLIIMGTAVLGTLVARAQGMGVLRRMMASGAQGVPPVEPAIEGSLLFLAGGLLISPGPIGDLTGLLLLIPPLRLLVARWLLARMTRAGGIFTFDIRTATRDERQTEERWSDRRTRPPRGGPIIEGEYQRVDEPPAPGDAQPKPTPLGDSKRRT